MPPANQLNFPTAPPSALSPEASVNGNLLHGTRKPHHVIEEELPWHRTAAFLFAAGETTIKDVAIACDVDPATVSNLLRQGWFQERVTTLMAEKGGRDIMQLFRGEMFSSLVTLIEIRNDPQASRKDKIVCAKDILDRTLGKAVQRVEQTGAPTSSDPVAEVARLEGESHDSSNF